MYTRIKKWEVFEIKLSGPSNGNPFRHVLLNAEFECGQDKRLVSGFYDGSGCYRIRFMPDREGIWHYTTRSSSTHLNSQTGMFQCVTASIKNHGPVRVRQPFHFSYADGVPFFPFGTTCYAWAHQGSQLEHQTIKTLANNGFNKIRMCLFPKHYVFNNNEPKYNPFRKSADGSWDFTQFDCEFFHHFERLIIELGKLGIEADVILFHPYDRWGYSTMNEEDDHAYLRYVLARLSAYRNVWWSLANEYDLMLSQKPMCRWDRFFEIISENDPYSHLRSIHNCRLENNYDHTKEQVTHVSLQHWDVKSMPRWRSQYGKPVINDECEYEGNIEHSWGNISARELVHRFWICVCYGGYSSHGETYEHPDNILWWSKGGCLYGQSAPRISFLRQILEGMKINGLTPIKGYPSDRIASGECGNVRLIYFGEHQPRQFIYHVSTKGTYCIDVIDTWEMTVKTTRKIIQKSVQLELPGKIGIAICIYPTSE